jgi:hypothetical protein
MTAYALDIERAAAWVAAALPRCGRQSPTLSSTLNMGIPS